tara:strand:- start:1000 stop:2106 length:1107 start_codon:yes stop_codon:yes gene_type:complete
MKKEVKYFDLIKQYKSIQKDIDKNIKDVLLSSSYVLGPKVRNFETNFSKFCSSKYAIGVNSGTSALHLALLACSIGKGDEVITVSMTFIATAMAISYTGAKPVFVDIDKSSKTMDTSLIESKINSKTKAIMPVHLYGQCADLNKIKKIAKKYNLFLIEDAAQAHGAKINGKPAGSIGDVAAFSFYPGKNLGAYGEAGIITTNNKKIADHVKKLRDWGQSKKYHHDFIAFNYRMDGIQGAILDIKLKKLNKWIKKRRLIASKYQKNLSRYNLECSLEEEGMYHTYHVFSVFTNNRDSLRKYLNKKGIQTSFHYPIPVHQQKPYLKKRSINLPITDLVAKTQLSLPIYPEMSIHDVNKVINEIINWKKNN